MAITAMNIAGRAVLTHYVVFWLTSAAARNYINNVSEAHRAVWRVIASTAFPASLLSHGRGASV